MPKIYIKTEMAEMPKGCRWVSDKWNIDYCEAIDYCRDRKIFVLLNPFEPQRAHSCPLVKVEEADNEKTI